MTFTLLLLYTYYGDKMIIYESDSREVLNGQTFVAIKGETVDGHNYIGEAIKKGATKIICEHEIDFDIPYEIVSDTKEYLSNALKNEYSKELKDLFIIGVTGTNGKTTSCFLIYQMLQKLNKKVAYIGTIGFYYQDDVIVLNNTTPDILELYKLLFYAKSKGCDTIVMEVSSHGLAFNRLNGINISIAAFTNLTQDHLEFHKNMKGYLDAKLKIIDLLKRDGTLIVNNDDKYSKDFAKRFKNVKSIGTNADYKIINYDIKQHETRLKFSYDNKTYDVIMPLTSKFNIYNYLTMLSIVNQMGVSIDKIIKYTNDIKPPKGRCELYEFDEKYIVIDYAHTPDAVEKVIKAYIELKENKIITLLGCGGDRDSSKRPVMGKIATELSDYVIFTNDNPRTEDPEKIMSDILKGVEKNNYDIVYDRAKAIEKAMEIMNKKDILLILGKGHENYQIIGHKKTHLDDSEEVLKFISNNKKETL